MIIHLNGMPGVGKLTTAQILADMFSARLVDNHRIIDTVRVCCDRATPAYMETLLKVTDIVYKELEKRPQDEIFVFTNSLSNELPVDIERFRAVENLAEIREVPFVPVLLSCALPENKERLIHPSRSSRKKLMDSAVLDDLYETYTMYHPKNHPYALSLDTTVLKPEEVAGKIARHVKDI